MKSNIRKIIKDNHSSQVKITIPKHVAERMGYKQGDRLRFSIVSSSQVMLQRVVS